MSQDQGGGRGPQPDDDKRPARQTDETAGGAIKQPQQGADQKRDLNRGAEPSTGDAARRR
jgi:hypothetical protein